jgi:hypothetical protein
MDRGIDRFDAYCLLLAVPDPPEMPHRGRRYTQAGSSALLKDGMKRHLALAYLGHRLFHAGDEAVIVSVRRTRLRLMRRSA